MPKTDWSARSSPPRRRHWPVPPEAAGAQDGDRPPRGRAQGPGKTAAGRQRRHFVAPYPYTDDQREAIGRALAACGLGDATAREIFIGAIAYDLAVLEAALTDQSAAPAPSPTLPPEPAPAEAAAPETTPAVTDAERELATHAAACAEALAALDADARQRLLATRAAEDPLRRGYGAAYLDALASELASLAALLTETGAAEPEPQPEAPDTPTLAPPPAATAPGTSPDDTALAFVRHAASVYEQCFDARPAGDPDGPFAQALAAVSDATGIAIPTDARLLRLALGPR
jgi:hypothetical protein